MAFVEGGLINNGNRTEYSISVLPDIVSQWF